MGDVPKRGFIFRLVEYVNKSCKNGADIDTIATLNKDFCFQTFPASVANGLHLTFLYFLGHVYLLYVILNYFAVTWPMKRGNWHIFEVEKEEKLSKKSEETGRFWKKLPKTLAALRSGVTLFLIGCSVFLHMNAWPTTWKLPFNWAFTLRPQINVKPQMTMKARKSKSEILQLSDEKSCSGVASCRSKSCGALTEQKSTSGQDGPTTSMDLSLGLRLRDGITDKYWSSLEKLTDTFSLASELSRSDFLRNSLRTDSTNQSVASSVDFEFDQKELDAIDVGPINDLENCEANEAYLSGPGFSETSVEVDEYFVEFPSDSDDDKTFGVSALSIVEITEDEPDVKDSMVAKELKSDENGNKESKRETFA
uniref:Uncharacterized protein n=1 Tax=Panagrolaimus sp. JU765 TaxID=591449 RepID=A0AC34R6Q9_9BILA